MAHLAGHVAIVGAGAVVAFDALASVVSSPLGPRYEDLFFVSWLMYAGPASSRGATSARYRARPRRLAWWD